MNLRSIGQLVADRRREHGLTLTELASRADVGRSTLAALESGKLTELGLGRVARICEAVGLVLEARPMVLEEPLMAHRHITDTAGRELTRAAIDEVITRGDISAWRGLIRAMRADATGRIDGRVRETAAALADKDPRARAFLRFMSAGSSKAAGGTALMVHDGEG